MFHLFHAILLHLLFLSTLAQKPRIDDGDYAISLLVRNGNFSGWLSMNVSDAQSDAAIIGIDNREPGFIPTFWSVQRTPGTMNYTISNNTLTNGRHVVGNDSNGFVAGIPSASAESGQWGIQEVGDDKNAYVIGNNDFSLVWTVQPPIDDQASIMAYKPNEGSSNQVWLFKKQP
ncbi:hypothetical protein PILCRDRAFT_821736 [Piloderma croceum F 1598]|uniref:Ricin B lectin domain-containing protein n=1 Tax=Piloderma croceum (strain F 1598) TaxID=765440 RepID=A0A0C3FQ08_PILCF|nr:hypothetical protein PILCRDRAFT_821736 [Piloderma croceum F 1598]